MVACLLSTPYPCASHSSFPTRLFLFLSLSLSLSHPAAALYDSTWKMSDCRKWSMPSMQVTKQALMVRGRWPRASLLTALARPRLVDGVTHSPSISCISYIHIFPHMSDSCLPCIHCHFLSSTLFKCFIFLSFCFSFSNPPIVTWSIV